jgi:hypothetical protein
VTHELAYTRKNEILGSGAISIDKEIEKVCKYLFLSIISNAFSLLVILWVFWPVEMLLVVLLSYKVNTFLDNLGHAKLIIWNNTLQ